MTPARRKTKSRPLSTLEKYSRQVSQAAVSRATSIPRSTLWGWSHKGYIPDVSKKRARAAAEVVRAELSVDKAEVKELLKRLANVYKIRQQGFVAEVSKRRVETIDKWRAELKTDPTFDNVLRVREALEKAESSTKKIRDGDIGRTDPRTDERKIIATTEDYEGIIPPDKEADAYRIFGVDKDGKIIASTTYEGSFEEATEEFDEMASEDEYDSQVVGAIIQLTLDVD